MKGLSKYLIIIVLLPIFKTFGQDRIFTLGGEELVVTIKEIRETDVSFIYYGDTTENKLLIDKSDILKIVYANGIEESFGNADNEETLYYNDINRNTEPDRIITTDGKVIYCEIVEIKRFGINYIPVDGRNNYTMYIPNTKVDRIEYANGDVDYVSGSPGNGNSRRNPKDFSYLSPHFISLNVGPSIPFGLFGYNPNGSNSGNAFTGVDVNLDATYYIFRGLGFGITCGYAYNPFNSDQHLGTVQNNLPATATDININVDGWHNVYLLGGIGYYNEYNRILLDYKALFGGLFSFYPTATATYTDNNIQQTSVFTDDSQSIIFGGQASVRYFLNRKLAIKGNISMLFGKAIFDGLIRKDYQNGNQVSESVATQLGEMSISWINVTFGISYTLGK